MLYRDFGQTGRKISSLGFGCMRLPEIERDGKWIIDEDKAIPMLRRAYQAGVNYFDTAPGYCHTNSEIAVGKAFHDLRERVMLSTKLPLDAIRETGDYRRLLLESLKKMDTPYVDFYHFWGMSRQSFDKVVLKYGLLEEARKAKQEGLIRHISFSFHDDPEAIRYIIDTAEAEGVPMETLLLQYNLLDRKNEQMIAYAAGKGLGIVVMGPVGGGRLAAPTDLYTKLTGKPAIATYELAFKFVLGNPNVCCALSGMQTADMVDQNVQVASDPALLSEGEWAQLGQSLEQLHKFSELYCTGCAYCQPCPAGIDIPKIFGFYTDHNVYGLTDHAKEEMRKYRQKDGKTFSACKHCGLCERKCPQKLQIRQLLPKVEAVLGEK
ncbi:MAG: aldo/keto reductase [Christensenellales bacterium]|jgi:predicted aldo/keto reductase-like oxidoreductase